MRRAGLLVTLWVMAALAATPAAQVRADVALRAATELETVKGDLHQAIDAYKRIVDGYPSDRAVRAQALVRMADCYQKLGDAQAKSTYERVIREFADLPAAAEARASLGRFAGARSTVAGVPSTRMVFRASPSFFWFAGPVSPDGRFAPYFDWEGDRHDLNLHDLFTGRTRTLVAGGTQTDGKWAAPVDAAAFSRDGAQLAYTWSMATGPQRIDELRVISVAGATPSKPRTLVADPTMVTITARDWSPDGELIAVDIHRKGGARQIGVVATRTGAVQVLHEVALRRFSGMHFSPDGQHLLFDVSTAGSNDRDIAAINLKTQQHRSIVIFPGDDSLIGWTPDGKEILFTSTRSGAPGIWTAPFSASAIGDPKLVKANIAIEQVFRLSVNGTLWYAPVAPRTSDVKMGFFDERTGRFTKPPIGVTTDRVGTNSAPRLSPDGKSIGYISRRPEGHVFVIRSLASNDTREFRPLREFRNGNRTLWEWSADSKGIHAIGTTVSDQLGIHRMDVVTGKLTWSIPRNAPAGLSMPLHADGQKVRYVSQADGAAPFTIVEFDIATNKATELYRTADTCRAHRNDTLYCVLGTSIVRRDWRTGVDTSIGVYEPGRTWSVSPDERFLLTQRSVPKSTTHRTWWLTDTVTGQTRELLKNRVDAQRGLVWWSGKGDGMVVNIKKEAAGSPEAWWVPIDDSAPHRLPEIDGIVFDNWAQRGRSVDGRFVFEVAAPNLPSELWVLENFLPPAKKN